MAKLCLCQRERQRPMAVFENKLRNAIWLTTDEGSNRQRSITSQCDEIPNTACTGIRLVVRIIVPERHHLTKIKNKKFYEKNGQYMINNIQKRKITIIRIAACLVVQTFASSCRNDIIWRTKPSGYHLCMDWYFADTAQRNARNLRHYRAMIAGLSVDESSLISPSVWCARASRRWLISDLLLSVTTFV